MPNDPKPVTPTDSFLRLILNELRSLNERLGDAQDRPSAREVRDAVRSGPAVADGMTVTEQPASQPADFGVGEWSPEPCAVITARGTPCGRMPPCRYHGEQTTNHEEG